MRGEMEDAGIQPVSGGRGGMQRAWLDDDRCLRSGCRHALVTDLADGAHGRLIGSGVRVGVLDGGENE